MEPDLNYQLNFCYTTFILFLFLYYCKAQNNNTLYINLTTMNSKWIFFLLLLSSSLERFATVTNLSCFLGGNTLLRTRRKWCIRRDGNVEATTGPGIQLEWRHFRCPFLCRSNVSRTTRVVVGVLQIYGIVMGPSASQVAGPSPFCRLERDFLLPHQINWVQREAGGVRTRLYASTVHFLLYLSYIYKRTWYAPFLIVRIHS